MEGTNQEVPCCRFCFGESEPGRELFYPCKCDGSIKYVHQDCLLEWLKRSSQQNPRCELCGEPLLFKNIYRDGAPLTLTILELFKELIPRGFEIVTTFFRLFAIIALWGIFLPLFANWWFNVCWCSISEPDLSICTATYFTHEAGSIDQLINSWYGGLVNLCVIVLFSFLIFEIVRFVRKELIVIDLHHKITNQEYELESYYLKIYHLEEQNGQLIEEIVKMIIMTIELELAFYKYHELDELYPEHILQYEFLREDIQSLHHEYLLKRSTEQYQKHYTPCFLVCPLTGNIIRHHQNKFNSSVLFELDYRYLNQLHSKYINPMKHQSTLPILYTMDIYLTCTEKLFQQQVQLLHSTYLLFLNTTLEYYNLTGMIPRQNNNNNNPQQQQLPPQVAMLEDEEALLDFLDDDLFVEEHDLNDIAGNGGNGGNGGGRRRRVRRGLHRKVIKLIFDDEPIMKVIQESSKSRGDIHDAMYRLMAELQQVPRHHRTVREEEGSQEQQHTAEEQEQMATETMIQREAAIMFMNGLKQKVLRKQQQQQQQRGNHAESSQAQLLQNDEDDDEDEDEEDVDMELEQMMMLNNHRNSHPPSSVEWTDEMLLTMMKDMEESRSQKQHQQQVKEDVEEVVTANNEMISSIHQQEDILDHSNVEDEEDEEGEEIEEDEDNDEDNEDKDIDISDEEEDEKEEEEEEEEEVLVLNERKEEEDSDEIVDEVTEEEGVIEIKETEVTMVSSSSNDCQQVYTVINQTYAKELEALLHDEDDNDDELILPSPVRDDNLDNVLDFPHFSQTLNSSSDSNADDDKHQENLNTNKVKESEGNESDREEVHPHSDIIITDLANTNADLQPQQQLLPAEEAVGQPILPQPPNDHIPPPLQPLPAALLGELPPLPPQNAPLNNNNQQGGAAAVGAAADRGMLRLGYRELFYVYSYVFLFLVISMFIPGRIGNLLCDRTTLMSHWTNSTRQSMKEFFLQDIYVVSASNSGGGNGASPFHSNSNVMLFGKLLLSSQHFYQLHHANSFYFQTYYQELIVVPQLKEKEKQKKLLEEQEQQQAVMSVSNVTETDIMRQNESESVQSVSDLMRSNLKDIEITMDEMILATPYSRNATTSSLFPEEEEQTAVVAKTTAPKTAAPLIEMKQQQPVVIAQSVDKYTNNPEELEREILLELLLFKIKTIVEVILGYAVLLSTILILFLAYALKYLHIIGGHTPVPPSRTVVTPTQPTAGLPNTLPQHHQTIPPQAGGATAAEHSTGGVIATPTTTTTTAWTIFISLGITIVIITKLILFVVSFGIVLPNVLAFVIMKALFPHVFPLMNALSTTLLGFQPSFLNHTLTKAFSNESTTALLSNATSTVFNLTQTMVNTTITTATAAAPSLHWNLMPKNVIEVFYNTWQSIHVFGTAEEDEIALIYIELFAVSMIISLLLILHVYFMINELNGLLRYPIFNIVLFRDEYWNPPRANANLPAANNNIPMHNNHHHHEVRQGLVPAPMIPPGQQALLLPHLPAAAGANGNIAPQSIIKAITTMIRNLPYLHIGKTILLYLILCQLGVLTCILIPLKFGHFLSGVYWFFPLHNQTTFGILHFRFRAIAIDSSIPIEMIATHIVLPIVLDRMQYGQVLHWIGKIVLIQVTTWLGVSEEMVNAHVLPPPSPPVPQPHIQLAPIVPPEIPPVVAPLVVQDGVQGEDEVAIVAQDVMNTMIMVLESLEEEEPTITPPQLVQQQQALLALPPVVPVVPSVAKLPVILPMEMNYLILFTCYLLVISILSSILLHIPLALGRTVLMITIYHDHDAFNYPVGLILFYGIIQLVKYFILEMKQYWMIHQHQAPPVMNVLVIPTTLRISYDVIVVIAAYSLRIMKTLFAALLWLSLPPICIGYIFENMFIFPFRTNIMNLPIFPIFQAWTIGLIVLKLFIKCVLTGLFGEIPLRNALEMLFIRGFQHFDYDHFLHQVYYPIVIPLLDICLCSYFLSRFVSMYMSTYLARSLIIRFALHGYVLVRLVSYVGYHGISNMIRLHNEIRDSKYLVGMILTNRSSSSSSTTATTTSGTNNQ